MLNNEMESQHYLLDTKKKKNKKKKKKKKQQQQRNLKSADETDSNNPVLFLYPFQMCVL